MGLGIQIRQDRRLDITFSEALLGRALRVDDEHRTEKGVKVLLWLGRLIVDQESRGLLILVGWLTVIVGLVGHRFGVSVVEGRVRKGERGMHLKLLSRNWFGHDAETWVTREAIVAGQIEGSLLLSNDPVGRLGAHECAKRFPELQRRELPSITWLLLILLHKQQLCQIIINF